MTGSADRAKPTNHAQVLARSKRVAALVTGTPMTLRISASYGSVGVDVDGKRVVRAAIGKRPLRGRWGIGAPPGCRATWKELRLR